VENRPNSKIVPRNEGRPGAGDGAPLLQHGFAELLGIALPSFRMLNDLVRDYVVGNITAISEPKDYQYHFVCKPHDPDRLRVEPLAIEVGSDRHMHLPLQAGALPNSQSTDAWGKPQSVISPL
jgi:hypothetical protein